MGDYREEVCDQINEVVNFGLSEMTESCARYYLAHRNHYCDLLDIDTDTSDRMYLWIVSKFDPDFETHNI